MAPPGGARIPLATKPPDFRRRAHSLAALAAELIGAVPFSVGPTEEDQEISDRFMTERCRSIAAHPICGATGWRHGCPESRERLGENMSRTPR